MFSQFEYQTIPQFQPFWQTTDWQTECGDGENQGRRRAGKGLEGPGVPGRPEPGAALANVRINELPMNRMVHVFNLKGWALIFLGGGGDGGKGPARDGLA